jgi:ribosome-binding protein aMBF1 (putative translation factor)
MNSIAPARAPLAPLNPTTGLTSPVVETRRPGQRANSADRHVGARIRERRIMLGLSQQQLAQMIGVTYRAVQRCGGIGGESLAQQGLRERRQRSRSGIPCGEEV